jgi:hypothetical protein
VCRLVSAHLLDSTSQHETKWQNRDENLSSVSGFLNVAEEKNVNEMQRHWRNESGTPPPTCDPVARLRIKFGADRPVQNLDKKRSEDLAVQLTMEVFRQCERS